MKYATALGVAALVGQACAFPTAVMEAIGKNPAIIQPTEAQVKKRQFGINTKFDPAAQYVSNQGKYAFVAPGPTDLRGPCPGLNAMANHGYIPHNGYATIAQYVAQTFNVFGMGGDLGAFLATYAAVFDGDGLAWSIGGPPPQGLIGTLGLSNLLGTPTGLSGSHNKYESDVSPTRGDLYQYGNDYLVVLDQFKALYAYQADETEETSDYNLGVLTDHRVKRFAQSESENPYFFNNFFSGFQVQPAAYTFIYRFMSNKSQEFPEGRLSQNVLKSFFSITGNTPDEFVYTPGHESIPNNWYKRAIGDEYTIPFFEVDLLAAAAQHPQFLNIGGNTGKVNTFTGLDVSNLTGGVYNLQTLAEGNNALCFSYQLLISQAPDLLENLFFNIVEPLNKLKNAVSKASSNLVCPQLEAIGKNQFDAAYAPFPGYTELKSSGTY